MLTTSYRVEQLNADPKLTQVRGFVLKWALNSDTTPEIYACWKINKITHSWQDLVFICGGLQISGSSIGSAPVGQLDWSLCGSNHLSVVTLPGQHFWNTVAFYHSQGLGQSVSTAKPFLST